MKLCDTCIYRNNVEQLKPCIINRDNCEYYEKERDDMTREEKDKILKALAEDRNDYARECERRVAQENGKITGADYMLQRFLDVLRTEVEPQESEEICDT